MNRRRTILTLLLVLMLLVVAGLAAILLFFLNAGQPTVQDAQGWKHVTSIYGWGQASDELLTEPFSIDWHDQSLYVTEKGRSDVVQMTATGEFVRRYGGPGTEPGQLLSPTGLAVDVAGNVYVTDGEADKLVVYDQTGAFVREAQIEGKPLAVDFDRTRLLVTTQGGIRILDLPDLAELASWGSQGRGPGQYDHPNGVVFDPDTALIYVSDSNNLMVKAVNEAGDAAWQFGAPPADMNEVDRSFGLPAGMALANGYLFVVDALDGVVHILDLDGNEVAQVGSMGAADGQLLYPSDIVHMSGDRFAISEWKGARVQIFDIDVAAAVEAWQERPGAVEPSPSTGTSTTTSP